MTSMRVTEWRKLPVSLKELCIDTTLRCGQSFRWRKSSSDEWSCSLRGRILSLRQDDNHLHYRSSFPRRAQAPPTPPSSTSSSTDLIEDDDTSELVRHYFNLEPDLTVLYEQWSSADRNFKKKAPRFTGVRILRQDAWEALVGFICSSNNNIVRICQMVEKLCVNYGQLIGTIGSVPYYDFPSPAALIGSTVEPHLRQLGFGYRAKYLHQTAVTIVEHGSVTWLNQLRNPESPAFGQVAKAAGEMKEGGRTGYREAHEQLLDLSGVGPKVADCVCLMGLGWGEAVPVDTHVWQIAQRDYKFGKGKHKSLTTDTYNAIGNHFRRLWGKEAGWAHSVLFTADLKAFSGRLTSKVEVTTETVVKNDSSEVVKSKAMVKVEYKTERKIKSEIDMENDVVEVPESARTQRAKRRKTS